jgi:UDP-4-amino-4,6-dideoxy-N-acetyl-beta-L-altrosamine N-acetyltransferase
MIVGEKVILIGLTTDSIPKILSWVNNPDTKVLTGSVYPVSEFEHNDWIREKAKSKHDKLFIIQDKATKAEIGTIGMKNTDFINRNAEIYISVGDEKFRGSGYGTDALSSLVHFCFSTLNLHKLYLQVFEFNTGAIHSYEKAGFVTEGKFKEQHYADGRYYDVLFMAIINNRE